MPAFLDLYNARYELEFVELPTAFARHCHIRLSALNTGTAHWRNNGPYPANFGARWRSLDAPATVVAEHRLTLPHYIFPGQRHTIDWRIPAPTAGGAYHLEVGLVLENRGWLGDMGAPSITLETTLPPPPAGRRALVFNHQWDERSSVSQAAAQQLAFLQAQGFAAALVVEYLATPIPPQLRGDIAVVLGAEFATHPDIAPWFAAAELVIYNMAGWYDLLETIAWADQARSVFVFHGLQPLERLAPAQRELGRRHQAALRLARHASHLIAVDATAAAELAAYTQVPLASIALQPYTLAALPTYTTTSTEQAPQLVFYAPGSDQTALKQFLAALAALREQYPGLTALCALDQEISTELQKALAALPSITTRTVAPLDQPAIGTYGQVLITVADPATWQATLGAMAAGRPVIQLVRPQGLAADPAVLSAPLGDVATLVNQLTALLKAQEQPDTMHEVL